MPGVMYPSALGDPGWEEATLLQVKWTIKVEGVSFPVFRILSHAGYGHIWL